MDAIKLHVQAHILKAKIDERLNVFSVGTCQSNDVEHKGLDLGCFPVSSKLVQVRDTSESAIYIHRNGPRHIKTKIDDRQMCFQEVRANQMMLDIMDLIWVFFLTPVNRCRLEILVSLLYTFTPMVQGIFLRRPRHQVPIAGISLPLLLEPSLTQDR
jgi:hypothetical protein